MQVQIIDDVAGKTLVAVSSKTSLVKKKDNGLGGSAEIGKKLAAEAAKKGIKQVVFDRGGYKYHGRVKALAEAMRGEGIEF